MIPFARILGRRLAELLLLMVGLSTLLFLLLRATGDPAAAIAGADADAEALAAVRAEYGFDAPLSVQLGRNLVRLAHGDFGTSLASQQPALEAVITAIPATLLLATLAMLLTIVVALPAGAWIGSAPERRPQRLAALLVYVLQGTPGFAVALVLVQVFAVSLAWVPAIGFGRPSSWILPAVSLSIFLAPKLTRVVAANVSAARAEEYVRAARAGGATEAEVLRRHILPNALLGAVALIGSQFAFLIGGVVVIETIFAWPGLGRLLIQSTLNLDFPVVQAAALCVAVLVYAVNALTDLVFVLLDPRLRRPAIA
ncbi:ABC transporter permease [Polymorphobacter sp.]|uniref:ABC transporter permease n=1 Tax=Polymorphobacter sp. TaxID=1909290 RepID=UPI003F720609